VTSLRLVSKIITGTKTPPLPGDDGNPEIVVVREFVKNFAKLRVRWRMQGIQSFRSIEFHCQHMIGFFDITKFGHASP
jgi:hypothetical protein